jgi:hypothetical protein
MFGSHYAQSVAAGLPRNYNFCLLRISNSRKFKRITPRIYFNNKNAFIFVKLFSFRLWINLIVVNTYCVTCRSEGKKGVG